ncbi:MAG: hypothetical protein E6713_06065 [Sporomusaceae bacterium]|nr:hypothetical protein [Sporomusaceae bacterium]
MGYEVAKKFDLLQVRELTDHEKQYAMQLTPLLHTCVNAKNVDANQIRAYAIALSDMDLGAVSAGVTRCMRTNTFFPSIPEIREAAQVMEEHVMGTAMKTADEAWKEVLEQIQVAHIYKTPQFSTPEIEVAARRMGWIDLCQTQSDKTSIVRAQFFKIYASVCQQKREKRINDQVLQTLSGCQMIKSQAVTKLIDTTAKEMS